MSATSCFCEVIINGIIIIRIIIISEKVASIKRHYPLTRIIIYIRRDYSICFTQKVPICIYDIATTTISINITTTELTIASDD